MNIDIIINKYNIVTGRWLPNLPNQVFNLKATNVGPDWSSKKEDALPSGQHMILDEIDFGFRYTTTIKIHHNQLYN